MQVINNHEHVKTLISEEGQTTKICVDIPSAFNLSHIENIEDAYSYIVELTPIVKNISNQAFIQKQDKSWAQIQNMLYFWNYKDLTRKNRINDYSALIEHALRKSILDIEHSSKSACQLECLNDFTPHKAVEELSDKVLSHRINNHPLLEEMQSNGLPKKALKAFLENYYVNNRLFHLFIAALSLSSPFNHRVELAGNFFDEMGEGDLSLAHPNLFLKNFNSFGVPSVISPEPEALHLVNAKTYAAFLSGDYYFGMGGFGYIELAMPNQMIKILKGLEKSGLPKQDLEFWDAHITLDLEHGKTWFSEMLQLIKNPTQAQRCLEGGSSLLEARAKMFDSILRFL